MYYSPPSLLLFLFYHKKKNVFGLKIKIVCYLDFIVSDHIEHIGYVHVRTRYMHTSICYSHALTQSPTGAGLWFVKYCGGCLSNIIAFFLIKVFFFQFKNIIQGKISASLLLLFYDRDRFICSWFIFTLFLCIYAYRVCIRKWCTCVFVYNYFSGSVSFWRWIIY